MKFEEHVAKIRLKVEEAVKNTLDRCGITDSNSQITNPIDENIEVGNISTLIDSIRLSGKDWKSCYEEIVDDYTFTLFNRLVCMKVLEAHGLYPEMISQRERHAGKSYAHYMWLESNPSYNDYAFEGLDKYLSWQFDQLSSECDLFNTSIPLHLVPTAMLCKEIVDLINEVDTDEQIEDDIWQRNIILSQIYEIYNESKKQDLKDSGDKVEYDKVHIQSQIYTPEWVVQFLVDNSLGKMYLEMYPDSSIKNTHKIMGDFSCATREPKALDEIKIIDPCVGSGNFLLYCFDLLCDMYEEQIDLYGADYSKKDIPKYIIENNLYGIDLDERAVQLTKVGLFIKAKTKKSNIAIDHYNVVSASFRLPEYEEIGVLFESEFFSKRFGDLLIDVWSDLQQAYKYGSLLRIDEKFEEVKISIEEELGDHQLSMFTYEKSAEFDLFASNFYGKLGEAIRKYAVDDRSRFFAETTTNAMTFLKIVTDKYDVVASNPPYTDSSAYSGTDLGIFINENYRKPYNCTTNLYACFICRNIEYCLPDGYIAMIHPHTYMTIDSYKDVRKLILSKTSIICLVDYGLDRVNLFGPGILLDAVWQVIRKSESDSTGTVYFNITENQQEKYKKSSFETCLSDYIAHITNNRIATINQKVFKGIEGTPFLFNMSDGLREKFNEPNIEKSGIKVCAGLQTGDNERFIRLWWEISNKKNLPIDETWYAYSKGGPYCKWYGNNWATVNWKNDGEELRSYSKAVLRNQDYYLRKGITFTGRGSKGVTFRLQDENTLFDVGGSCIFPTGSYNNLEYLLAFLNSTLALYLIDRLNPTVNTQVGDLKRVPFVKPNANQEKDITDRASQCIRIKKEIDSRYILNGAETSPLLFTDKVSNSIRDFIVREIEQYCEILFNEQIINSVVSELYSLDESDLSRLKEKMGVCVTSIPIYNKAKTMYESLESKPSDINTILHETDVVDYSAEEIADIKDKIRKILFANNNGIEDFCHNNELNPVTIWYFVKYEDALPLVKAKDLVFEWILFAIRDILSADQDGILCINDTDSSIVQVLEEYADKHGITSAQLLQMEEFLGKKIRNYMENDFFVELMNYTNVFMYLPKTPFVWHLSSGEKRGFEAFLSIYKWNANLLYKLKTNYISKRRDALEFRKIQLGDSNTARIIEEKEKIDAQLKEIDQFVNKIDDLIASGYAPETNDGVGKNIAPLQARHMLKSDVLNANQLKRFLKADW